VSDILNTHGVSGSGWNAILCERFSLFYSNILIYVQQDATLHSLFYLETALHVLGGAITHHQERKQLYLPETCRAVSR
jgi:hypothetical protein